MHDLPSIDNWEGLRYINQATCQCEGCDGLGAVLGCNLHEDFAQLDLIIRLIRSRIIKASAFS
jgi:hypothetical protein